MDDPAFCAKCAMAFQVAIPSDPLPDPKTYGEVMAFFRNERITRLCRKRAGEFFEKAIRGGIVLQ